MSKVDIVDKRNKIDTIVKRNNNTTTGTQLKSSQKSPHGNNVSVSFDYSVSLNLPEDTTLNKAFKYLFSNPKKSIREISLAIEVHKDTVKTNVRDRSKGAIITVDKIGKEYLYSLSDSKRIDLEVLLESKQRQREKEKEKLKIKAREKEQELKQKIGDALKTFEGNYTINDGVILIDAEKFQQEQLELFQLLEKKPESTLTLIASSFENLDFTKCPKIRFSNLDVFSKKTIESLRSKDLDSLMVIEGRIRSVSNIRPQVVDAKFECRNCGSILELLQTEKKFIEPSRCSCGWKGGFLLLSKEMVDVARVVLEDPEIENSYDKKSLFIFLRSSDLISEEEFSKFTPGNEIKVAGILKEVPVLLPTGAKSTRFDWALETLSVEELDPEKKIENLPPELIDGFEKLCEKIDDDGLDVIVPSIAPEVEGYEFVKKCLVLQASQKKNNPKNQTRTKSNVLLIGSPGVSKSVLCEFAKKITYGSVKGGCGGATAVGLIATVEKDDYGWIVKPGLLPLARELVILEEFNQISDDDKPKLQEGMSEMKITINKASIHTVIPVTAGVLANANPQSGDFNEHQDIIQQFNLYPPIKNRFDVIFAMKDIRDFELDKRISKKMLMRQQNTITSEHPISFLRDFFLFVRCQEEPKFSDELLDYIPEFYANNRKLSKEVNARFQESLERLCKASAKLRLSNICEKKDLERAMEVLKESHHFIGVKIPRILEVVQ